ncbi:hypothetical protein [Pelosinus baikalensis]|uniref:Nitrite/sulphite reductase 4Fe-4S domain-containing protein n=1 Tax=Pelosinus baikalensis TaxID=2892015 RepID=A0ABS8HST9_9FIRM|nr:hypothetical protein [Pelosinus baikalensis]
MDSVLALVDKVVLYYKENGKNYERMGNMIERLGIEKVKQDILG